MISRGLPERWCPAEVLHVYDGANLDIQNSQSEQTRLAKGIIPGETWDEQVDEVEFLKGYTLRSAANRPDPTETEGDEGSVDTLNPATRWRYRESPSNDDEEDAEWTRKAASNADTVQTNVLIRTQTGPQPRATLDVEVKALRYGHESLTIELEKVKRELVAVTYQLRTVQNLTASNQICTSAHCVLPRLRHKLALRMQTGLKQTSATLGKRKSMESGQTSKANIIDGIYYDALRARVECTLHQFETVCRHIKTGCPSDSVIFFPEYSYTQRPSESSSDFRILFKTFSQICEIIGISSTSDQKEMARKCGRGTQGDLLRMLGTYSFDEKDVQGAAFFFPGTSCGTASITAALTSTVGKIFNPSEQISLVPSSEAGQRFPAVVRKSREWNHEDSRYIHKLRLQRVKLPDLTEDCKQREAFAISWKRAADNAGKGWSFSLSDKGHIFGWLEISLPFIQVQGRHGCQELGGVATDDMWDDILRVDLRS